jgi:hypothetical protein
MSEEKNATRNDRRGMGWEWNKRYALLRPLSYLGAARPLMLPLYRLLPYLYLPDRSTAYTRLTSAVAAISMLSSYRPNMSTSVHAMPTFLIRLAFSHVYLIIL